MGLTRYAISVLLLHALAATLSSANGPVRPKTSVSSISSRVVKAAEGCTFTLDPTSLSFPVEGGTASVTITGSAPTCAWSVTAVEWDSYGRWFSISSGGTGAGSGTMVIQANANTVLNRGRSGSIVVGGQTLSVGQAMLVNCFVSGGGGSITVGPNGGSGTANITVSRSGCTVAVTSGLPGWVSVGAGVANGSTVSVPITVDANSSSQNRFATLEFHSGSTGGAALVSVSQLGASCSYSLTSSSANVPVNGRTGAVTVTTTPSDCPWTVSSNAPWLAIGGSASGSGNSAISYVASANTSGQTRTGTLTIAGLTFTVNQASEPCTYAIQPPGASFPQSGGNGSAAIQAPTFCLWAAASNASWVVLGSGASTGSGNGSLTYTVAANPGTQSRSASVTVGDQAFPVTQAGTPPSDPVLVTTSDVALYNTYSAFTLRPNDLVSQTRVLTLTSGASTAPYTSSVASDDSGGPLFVTVSPASGITPASITLTVNPAGLPPGTYTNVITFASGGASTTYAVALTIQSSATSPTGSTDPSKVGIFRQTPGFGQLPLYLLDRNGDGSCCAGDQVGVLGQTGDIPLAGDWTGEGIKKFGLYRPGAGLFVLDANNNGAYDGTGAGLDKVLFFAPQPGDLPVFGDWTGTGIERAGVFRGSVGTFYLDTNGDGSFVGRAFLGQPGDIPLVGNWNGSGRRSKVGVYRPSSVGGQPGNFFLLDTNGDGLYNSADQAPFYLGQSGDLPIMGDWNGDGRTKVGIFRPSGTAGSSAGLFVLDYNGNYSWDGPSVDKALFFAPFLNGSTMTSMQVGDIPVTGNWVPSYGAQNTVNVQGRTRTGIYRPSTGTFFLDVSGDGTFQGRAYLGQSGDVPLGGPIINGATIVGVNQLGSF